MKNTTHIFIQINTEKIILIGKNKPSNREVRGCSIICDQGSLSIGSPIKEFAIDVAANQDLHFSIVPLDLMSYHKVYFTKFNVVPNSEKGMKMKNKDLGGHELSFKVEIGKADKNAHLDFNLHAILEYEDCDGLQVVHLCIDPKIRVTKDGFD